MSNRNEFLTIFLLNFEIVDVLSMNLYIYISMLFSTISSVYVFKKNGWTDGDMKPMQTINAYRGSMQCNAMHNWERKKKHTHKHSNNKEKLIFDSLKNPSYSKHTNNTQIYMDRIWKEHSNHHLNLKWNQWTASCYKTVCSMQCFNLRYAFPYYRTRLRSHRRTARICLVPLNL